MSDLFLHLFENNPDYSQILDCMENNRINITGLTDTAKPHFLYGILKKTGKNIIVVAKNEAYVKKLSNMLSFFNINAHTFWEREFNFYNIDAKSGEMFLSRINTLENTRERNPQIYITTLDGLSQPVIPKEIFENFRLKLKLGEMISIESISEKLVKMGYQKVSMVEFKGQFSVRGDVVDIFNPLYEFPVRIEFFGDEIDSMRVFNEKTQLSVEKLEEAEFIIAREIVFDDDKKAQLVKKLRETLKKNISEELIKEIKSDIEKIENERYFHSIDKYINYIYDSNETFLDYFEKNNTVIVIDEPQRLYEKKEAVKVEREEMIGSLIEKGIIIPDCAIFNDCDDTVLKMMEFGLVGIMNILTSQVLYKPDLILNVSVTDTPTYYGKLNLFCEDIINYKNKGFKVVIPVPEKKINNFKSYLLNSSIISEEISEETTDLKPGVYLLNKNGVMGFNYVNEKFILLYDSSIFGEYKKAKKKNQKEQ